MKWIPIGLLALALGGCAAGVPQKEVVTLTKNQLVKVPDDLYNCPVVKTFPASATLTDLQVAKLLVQLQRNNVTCKNSLVAVKEYLAKAAATIH